MPDDPLYTIADAIAHLISKFTVEALNSLAPPYQDATDDMLVGPTGDELKSMISAHRADLKAGRPDDGVLLRFRVMYWLARGETRVEAQRRAAADVATVDRDTVDRDEEERLQPPGRARRRLSSLPQPAPPRLRHFEVDMALANLADDAWQQGRLDFLQLKADRSAMRVVPRSPTLRFRRVLSDDPWAITSRDHVVDRHPIGGLHITKAGIDALFSAVQNRLSQPPWLIRRTREELEKILKDARITLERWAVISPAYEARLRLRSEPPLLEMRDKTNNPDDYDVNWCRSAGIKRREIRVLRRVYLGDRYERRKLRET